MHKIQINTDEHANTNTKWDTNGIPMNIDKIHTNLENFSRHLEFPKLPPSRSHSEQKN